MFKIREIKEIIEWVDRSSLQEFTLEHEATKIMIKKSSLPSVPPQHAMPAESSGRTDAALAAKGETSSLPATEHAGREIDRLHKIVSPIVGTFYAAPEPGAPPFVKVGDQVREDTVVCIVEAMKLFNEVEAEVKGKIVDILVQDGQLVEHGQPLFLVQPDREGKDV
ncbi:acetyl-CoA carboxylase biotin carboxyl carrier protein [Bacillaceae bacterium]